MAIGAGVEASEAGWTVKEVVARALEGLKRPGEETGVLLEVLWPAGGVK